MLRDLFSLFPAYAGVILLVGVGISCFHAFPRIRGGDPLVVAALSMGFSLFPAYAGVILHLIVVKFNRNTFPRIRGGDPRVTKWNMPKSDFSPHTRG